MVSKLAVFGFYLLDINIVGISHNNNVCTPTNRAGLRLSLKEHRTTGTKYMLAVQPYGPPVYRGANWAQIVVNLGRDLKQVLSNL